MRVRIQLQMFLLVAAVLLVPGTAAADHGFQIGPIPGLTTAWHPAPEAASIPLDVLTKIELRRRIPAAGATIEWSGAVEVSTDGQWSVAECPLSGAGQYVVIATTTFPNGSELENRVILDAVAIRPESIEVSPIRVEVDPVELDQSDLNASTFEYYRGHSIADLRQVSDNWYRTSTRRPLRLSVSVDPPGFAPLMEWRSPGRTLRLGSSQTVTHIQPHIQQVSVGPTASQRAAFLETYSVKITSHVSNQDVVPEGEPVTFSAVTLPPGHEDEITWLASTKYGSCDPVMGQGPEFTVRFEDTWGPHPSFDQPFQWLGVKADHTIFNQDQKMSSDLFACDLMSPQACGDWGTCVEQNQRTFCECRSGYSGARCEINLRPLRIQRNAPADDFELLKPPTPEQTGQRSTQIIRRIQLTDSQGACSWETLFPVEEISPVEGFGSFSIGVQADRATAGWEIILRDPSGQPVDFDEAFEGADPAEVMDGTLGYTIEDADAGDWSVIVLADEPSCGDVEVTEGTFGVSFETSTRGLYTHVTSLELHLGKDVGVSTYLFDRDGADQDEQEVPPPPVLEEIAQATMTVTFPSGSTATVAMWDAGAGTWSAAVRATEEGVYSFLVDVEAESGGFQIRRTDTVEASVVPAKVQFEDVIDKVRALISDDGDSLLFRFRIELINSPTPESLELAQTEEYFLSTEIWALLEGDAEPFPMAWAGNLATPIVSQAGDSPSFSGLTIRLDEQWISNIKSLPRFSSIVGFVFRNAVLRDARTRSPMDLLAEHTYLLPTSPFDVDYEVTEYVDGLNAEFIDPEDLPRMLVGAPPDFLETIQAEIAEAIFPEFNGKLLLVHGWCGGFRTWDESDFVRECSGSQGRILEYFGEHSHNDACNPFIGDPFPCQDGKQISTSKFADRLAAFLNDEDGRSEGRIAGIVGHSQGGLAALVMLNDTHTSLNTLVGGSSARLIQTVGSPWRGSPLFYGALAPFRVLGRKGQDCSSEDAVVELAPVAVANLLSCVPSSSRREVHYKRTQHKKFRLGRPNTWFGRWCRWFTSKVLLVGADDGAVQVFGGALKEGNDLGVTTELCHTGEAKYPDQRRDEDIVRDFCRNSFLE